MIRSNDGELRLSGSTDTLMAEFVHILHGLRTCLSEKIDEEEVNQLLTAAFFAGMTIEKLSDIFTHDAAEDNQIKEAYNDWKRFEEEDNDNN